MTWRILLLTATAALIPATTLAQIPAAGTTQRTQTHETATKPATNTSAPQAATQPQLQPQQLDTLSQTIAETEVIENLEKRVQALEEQAAATPPADITTTDMRLSQPSELLENLPLWLDRTWQWGLIWGFLWWIPWFVFSWQWWRRRFWIFAWPWPWWWWLPWLWFIPWLIWGWWWGFCWWFAWCWLWWWLPWIFWLFWWLIVIKHVLQWLRRPGTLTTP